MLSIDTLVAIVKAEAHEPSCRSCGVKLSSARSICEGGRDHDFSGGANPSAPTVPVPKEKNDDRS